LNGLTTREHAAENGQEQDADLHGDPPIVAK
jgi:hypothetical protein